MITLEFDQDMSWNGSWKWTRNLATSSKPIIAGQPGYTLNFPRNVSTYITTRNLDAGFLLNQLNSGGAVTIAGTNRLAHTSKGAAPDGDASRESHPPPCPPPVRGFAKLVQ